MPGSTPASVTADPRPPSAVEVAEQPTGDDAPRGRVALGRVLRNPAGVVGLALTVLVVGTAVLAGVVAPTDPFKSVGGPLLGPSGSHLMGTDNLGRDIAGAVVHGARTSMLVSFWVMVLTGALGVAVGALAGYRGGFVDDLLMRLTELVQSVPVFFLAILVVALFGSGIDNLIWVLALTLWPTLARVVRAETFSLRQRDFVEAARSVGATHARIVIRHVLPNVLPSAVVVLALLGSRVILLEASLSFLGLGDPNAMSWGFLVSNAQQFIRVAWWMSIFPGAAIAVAVLGINLLSDALSDALSPYSATRGRGRRRNDRRRAILDR